MIFASINLISSCVARQKLQTLSDESSSEERWRGEEEEEEKGK